MKTLIYSVATGSSKYFEMARRMFKSLRLSGYAGEAILLSDYPEFTEEAMRDLDVAVLRVPRAASFADGLIYRARHADLCSLRRYDAVMYLDADILVIKPLDQVFAFAEKMGITMSGADVNIAQPHTGALLTPAEKTTARVQNTIGFNTGAFCVMSRDCDHFFRAWLAGWETATHIRDNLADQQVMNCLAFRGTVHVSRWPWSWVDYPLWVEGLKRSRAVTVAPRQGAKLVHFCGPPGHDKGTVMAGTLQAYYPDS